MGRDPAEQATPDLFSTNTVGDASPPPPKRGGTEAATETAPQRHILPKNLRAAVKHLSDSELDLMHAATLEEMKRRGRKPPGVETAFRLDETRLAPTRIDECERHRSLIDPWSGECCSLSL